MKKIKIPILLLLFFLMSIYIIPKFSLNTQQNYSPYDNEIKYYTIGDGKKLKVGIISDSQLMPDPSQTDLEIFTLHLKSALQILYNNKVDSIIFAGDICDLSTKYAYDLFNKTYTSIFNSSSYEPILNIIMGNHDYYNNKEESIETLQKRFEESLFQKPFTHKVINGFHFINWGSQDSSFDHCNDNITWIKNQIDFSIKNTTNEKNPIFITTHVNPKNTVYGSDDWGNDMVYNLFNNYSQIISFSGHSHYPLIDERSIFQGNFTAIQTQSTSYIDTEYGFENGKMLRNEYEINIASNNSMGLIMNIENNEINIKRFSIEKNEFYGQVWNIKFPIYKKDFKYTFNERKNKRNKPFFEDLEFNHLNNGSDFIVVDYYNFYPIIEFKQAFHEDFIHHYKLDFYNRNGFYNSFYYFSDFFLMPQDRREYFRLKISNNVEVGDYYVRIYAFESFGKMSDNYLQGNVTIIINP